MAVFGSATSNPSSNRARLESLKIVERVKGIEPLSAWEAVKIAIVWVSASRKLDYSRDRAASTRAVLVLADVLKRADKSGRLGGRC